MEVGFGQPAERRSLLDRAHRGDIEGALGRVSMFDTGPRLLWRRRMATLLAVMGPGLIVMVADNDAGGLSVYAQAGQDYGLRLLWVLLVLAPVLFVNQEMVARLGAVTGAGHARLIFERFGRRWGRFALADLLALNGLTLVTEFIGVALGLGYFGVSRYLSVPLAAVGLIAVTVGGSFRRWERVMYALVAVNLVAVPLALLSRQTDHGSAAGAVPALSHGPGGGMVLFVIALVGTTVAPWQLFFQQAVVVDKRITARWLAYERVDTLIGTVAFATVAVAVLVTCALAFRGTALHGAFADAAGVARQFDVRLGGWAGTLFALGLVNASLLGAGVVTLTTSYALGEVLGVRHSLHRSWRNARTFHGSFVAAIVVAAAVVLVPGVPLGLATTGVQALAGVLLPSATVFLLLLCNDRAILGPWTNPPWLNAVAAVVVGGLLVLSALLMVTTLHPGLDVTLIAAAIIAGLLVVFGLVVVRSRPLRRGRRAPSTVLALERWTWSTPPLETLAPPLLSRARRLGLVALRLYLLLAASVVVVKIGQLLFAA